MAKATVTPPLPSPPGSQSLRAALTGMARRLTRRLSCAPRALQVAIVAVLLVGLTAGGYYSRIYSQTRARERDEAAAWRSFDEAVGAADFAEMDSALDRLLTLRPGDRIATALKAALVSGSADADDTKLAAALVSRHLGQDRLVEAAREARKVIVRDPKHWRSLCVLAHHAVRMNRDPDEARRWLDALPDPNDPGTRLDAGGLLHAVRLSDHLGRDSDPLRRAIVVRVLPLFRSGAADSGPPLAKVQLIECYLEPFSGRSHLPQLSEYWGTVSRLADSAVVAAADVGDIVALVRLGILGQQLREALLQLHEHGLVPEERFATLAKELDQLSRRAWLAVNAREPARVEPYAALAVLSVRVGDYRQAAERLLAGLATCGDRPELLDPLSRLATATGNTDAAVTLTRAAAEKDPTDPLKWCLAATATSAAGRYAEAIEACEKARRHAPSHRWACRIQASAWLETGEGGKAVQLLRSLGERTVRSDPRLVRLAVRALVETGDATTAAALTDELEKTELGRGSAPVVTIAAIRGLLDARMDPARAKQAAVRSLRLTTTWSDDPQVTRLLADAHFRFAELASPPWDPAVARTALHAYARLPNHDQTSPDVISAVAAIQLKALKDAPAAWRTLAPFRDSGVAALLRPRHWELLAAASTAIGKPELAIAILERNVRDLNAPSGCRVQLALAYRAAGRSADARAVIARPPNVPARSANERAEWLEATALVNAPEP